MSLTISPSVKKLASVLREAKNIVCLIGAGVSVSSDIPDFRSRGGMYDTLKPELLTATESQRAAMKAEPTTVVSKSLFMANQFPYHEVRLPFILGIDEKRWKPSASHFMITLLEKHNKLRRVYDQNIDGLLSQASISDARHTCVHGTLHRVCCENCHKTPQPDIHEYAALCKKHIKNIYEPSLGPKESSNILCQHCSKPTLKPSTVLYGGSMPQDFFKALAEDFEQEEEKKEESQKEKESNKNNFCDAMLCIGSSMTVYPAAGIPEYCKKGTPIFVLNNTDISSSASFAYELVQGDCDDIFVSLACELGMLEELAEIAESKRMTEKSVVTVKRYQKLLQEQQQQEASSSSSSSATSASS